MKKLIALMMAAVLVLALCACGAPEDESLYGKYTLYAMDYEDVVLMADELFENENYIELSKGGKCVYMMDGEAANIKWKSEGSTVTLTAADGDLTATVENGIFALDYEGTKLYYVAEGADVSSLKALSMADYLATLFG